LKKLMGIKREMTDVGQKNEFVLLFAKSFENLELRITEGKGQSKV
jgi:hypothetical protein